MPGMYCSVEQCCNSRLKNPDLSFHRFPRDERKRQEWVVRCKPKNGKSNLTSCYICSEHFEPEMFKTDMRAKVMNLPSRRELVAGAIPVLKLPSALEICPEEKSRKRRKLIKEELEDHKPIICEGPSNSTNKNNLVNELQSEPIIRRNVLFDERRINSHIQNEFEIGINYKKMYNKLLEKYEQISKENAELIRRNEELQKIIREANCILPL